MKIAIFGSGYVGLVSAACLADVGHRVMCVDLDQERVDALSAGHVPIYEPGLTELLRSNIDAGHLSFSTDGAEAVRFGDLLMVAVGTPQLEDGSADISAVLAVARTIGENMDGYKVVVGKSTVPVGTADKVSETIAAGLRQRNVSFEYDVCSNPEFLKEGNAIEDFARPARIIVGTGSERVRKLLHECYAPYNRNHDKMIFMDVRSAELTKYAANAMLATKISFMNEMANIAERFGADIEHVRQGIGSDPRIGYNFIYPGAGYGGSCFPKDVRAIAKSSLASGYRAELLEAVESVNNRQKSAIFEKLTVLFDGELSGRTIGVWGLSFKPNTDDMREAPSRTLIDALLGEGAHVKAFDPKAMEEAARIYGDTPGLSFCGSLEEAADGADALAICTEWKQFRVPDFDWLKQHLRLPAIVDGRNLYDPEQMRANGFLYFGIGRGEAARGLGLAAQKALALG